MKKILLPFLSLILLLVSCTNEGSNGPSGGTQSRTVFIYMAADNSLGNDGYDRRNLNNMVQAATAENMNGGKIIIFHDKRSSGDSSQYPELLEISADKKGVGQLNVLKQYTSDLDGSDPAVFRQAVSDMRSFGRSDSYGLIVWSHSTGWMPAEMHPKYTQAKTMGFSIEEGGLNIIRDPFSLPESRAVNQDGSSWMDMEDLANAIEPGLFDFVIIDACLAGGIETAYLFKDKTKTLMASPAEVLGEGLPYDRVVPYLFKSTPVLGQGGVAEVFYEYYKNYTTINNVSDTRNNSVTTAVYDCTAMDELVSVFSDVTAYYKPRIATIDVGEMQVYDRYRYNTMFDIRDYVRTLAAGDDSLIQKFENALDKAVTYKATSGLMVNLVIDPDRYSGMSTYIPLPDYEDLNEYYYRTPLYKAIATDDYADRTMFIYMAGDNSLSSTGLANMSNTVSGLTKSDVNNGRVIVFYDSRNDVPKLIQIAANKDGVYRRTEIKSYEEVDSSDPEVLSRAIEDLQVYAPSSSYGLVVWSHGTGWMPASAHGRYTQKGIYMSSLEYGSSAPIRDPFVLGTRAIVQDGNSWMGFEDLAEAIPAGLFDYVVFDACLMGGAEMYYALSDKTQFVIASPAEVLEEGMPYANVGVDFFTADPRESAIAISRKTYEYYNNKSGLNQSSTQAVYDCSAADGLAAVMAKIYTAYGSQIPGLDYGQVQFYDRYSMNTMYDIDQFAATVVASNDQALYSEFKSALENAVIYKATTGRMDKLPIDIDKYSGMSAYIPLADYSDLNAHFASTRWGKAIGYTE